MKKFLIVIGLFLFSANVIAQNNATKKADKYFHRFEYVKAVEEYLKVVDAKLGDDYVYKQLGDAYYNMFNIDESIKWYAQIANANQKDPEVFFRYAQMLKSKANYEEANKQMHAFSKLVPNDNRAKVFLENPDYLPALLDIKKAYEVKILDLNSEQSDFGGIIHGNTLYFASARNLKEKKYGWLNQPYLDLYQASFKDNKFGEVVAVEGLNTKYHDGPVSISANGVTVYYSSESFVAKDGDKYIKDSERKNKVGQMNLFVGKKKGDAWGLIKELPVNSAGYSTSNPSISHDGKTLYFVSNMPGGLGGLDIWKVAVLGGGKYGEPVNLGDKVNSEANESFPFIDENNNLYFASNGRVGLGGLDVFMINLNEEEPAINLGKPVNSEKDDFSFTYNSEHKVAILSSNRAGQDNLYMAIPSCGVRSIVKVTDKDTGEVLANANVSILDDQGNFIAEDLSDQQGQVEFYTECDTAYKLQVLKDGYENSNVAIQPTDEEEVIIDAKLTPIKAIITDTEIILQEIIFDYDKSNITKDAAFILDNLVKVLKDYPEMIIEVGSHTDNRGSQSYNSKLSNSRALSTVQYVISQGISSERITGKGYGELVPKIDCKTQCTEADHQVNRRSEFKIVKNNNSLK